MRFDTVTVGILGLFVGMAIEPYVQLIFEWWLTRPKKLDPLDIHNHCKGCTIQ